MNKPTDPVPGPVAGAPDGPDALRLLRRQHDEARALMEAVAASNVAGRAAAFSSLVPLLAVHETAEEIVVYPALRTLGDEAERVAESRTTEEDEAKRLLAELESMGTEDPSFTLAFLEFQRSVEFHAEAEEREVFPLLEARLTAEEFWSMGRSLLRAEKFAPTHAHRMAPESALGNLVVGPFAAVVDKVRDALGHSDRNGDVRG